MAEAQSYTPRLKTLYRSEIRSRLIEKFGYPNAMMTPKITKIVVNMGVGDAVNDRKDGDGRVNAVKHGFQPVGGGGFIFYDQDIHHRLPDRRVRGFPP